MNYVPAPSGDFDEPLQILITTLDHNDYVGRIAIGRVFVELSMLVMNMQFVKGMAALKKLK